MSTTRLLRLGEEGLLQPNSRNNNTKPGKKQRSRSWTNGKDLSWKIRQAERRARQEALLQGQGPVKVKEKTNKPKTELLLPNGDKLKSEKGSAIDVSAETMHQRSSGLLVPKGEKELVDTKNKAKNPKDQKPYIGEGTMILDYLIKSRSESEDYGGKVIKNRDGQVIHGKEAAAIESLADKLKHLPNSVFMALGGHDGILGKFADQINLAPYLRRWIEKEGLVQADLSQRDLTRADLANRDLTKVNFYRTVLEEADLQKAILEKADLSKANLRGADLRGANLTNAWLRKADLTDADLRGAKLNGAVLTGAITDGAKTDGANLEDAIFEGETARLSKAGREHYRKRLQRLGLEAPDSNKKTIIRDDSKIPGTRFYKPDPRYLN